MPSWTISSTHLQAGSPRLTSGRSRTPSASSTKPACRPTSKSERAGTPAWPPSSDQLRRKASKRFWTEGFRSLETRKIGSDSTSGSSTPSAEIGIALLTLREEAHDHGLAHHREEHR